MVFLLVNLIHLPLDAFDDACVITQIFSVCRTILAYFEDKVDKSIGGKDDCCDICRNRFVS